MARGRTIDAGTVIGRLTVTTTRLPGEPKVAVRCDCGTNKNLTLQKLDKATDCGMHGIRKLGCGTGHRYTLDGVSVQGVTTIIGEGIPKEALNQWYADQVAGHVADNREDLTDMSWMSRNEVYNDLRTIPNRARDAAADRGKLIHDIAENLMNGKAVEYDPALEGYVRSCVQFLDDYEPRAIRNETVVASRAHSYCGTFDTVAVTPTEGVSVWDYKTGRSIWPESAVQLGGYFGAEVYCDENPDGTFTEHPVTELGIENGRIVHIREDGYDVYPVDDLPTAFQCFLVAAATARMRKHMGALLGFPLLTPALRLDGAA